MAVAPDTTMIFPVEFRSNLSSVLSLSIQFKTRRELVAQVLPLTKYGVGTNIAEKNTQPFRVDLHFGPRHALKTRASSLSLVIVCNTT